MVDHSAARRHGYVFVLPWELQLSGGVNQVVINLDREMRQAAEVEPLVLVNNWPFLRPVEKVVDGRQTIYVRMWSPWSDRGSVIALLKWIVASPLWIFDLLRLCRRHRVLAFNFHFASLSAVQVALLRFLGLYRGGLILSFHGADLREARKAGRIERALWKFTFHPATAVVACSRALAAEVSEFAGTAASRVHAIQNGLDVAFFLSNVDRATALSPSLLSREFILSVATWEWKKGLDVLLRAFASVRRTRIDLALVLVGRSGGAELDLRKLASKLAIENDVLFFEDIPHARVGLFLERARVFCLPSRVEPFGIAVLESGAYHLPVVASRVGGIPEMIVDGKTGLLVEPDDVDSLAAALNRVLCNPDLGRALGDRLYQHVSETFSWKRSYEEYRALFLP